MHEVLGSSPSETTIVQETDYLFPVFYISK